MYLHLGGDTVVPSREIIGIFDMENTSLSKYTREFLSRATKSGAVVNVSLEMPKSFVVGGGRERETVYVSQISPQTLVLRSRR